MAKGSEIKIFPEGQIHRDLLSCLKGMGLSYFYSQSYFYFQHGSISQQSLAMCKKIIFLSTYTTDTATKSC